MKCPSWNEKILVGLEFSWARFALFLVDLSFHVGDPPSTGPKGRPLKSQDFGRRLKLLTKSQVLKPTVKSKRPTAIFLKPS